MNQKIILSYSVLFSFYFGISHAAIVTNVDVPYQCQLHVEYNWGRTLDFDIPKVGKSTEINLGNHKIIRMSCKSYAGAGNEKTFCIVQKGLTIKTLKIFNEKDPFGDYPACKAE